MSRRRSYNHMERETRSLVALMCAISVAIIGFLVWVINALSNLLVKAIRNRSKKKPCTTTTVSESEGSAQSLLPQNPDMQITQKGSDDLLSDAIDVVVEAGLASTSILQRRLKVGYTQAARLVDQMEELGIVGQLKGSKPRQVLLTKDRYYQLKSSGTITRLEESAKDEKDAEKELSAIEFDDGTPTELFQDVNSTLHLVDKMDGIKFEEFTVKLLEILGYEDVSMTKASGDQGVDVLASRDGLRYAIQCKNYSAPLGNDPIQEAFTGKDFYGCHVAVVTTNSTFTSGAKALADKTGTVLWDREMLTQMVEKAISAKQQVTA